MSGCANFSQLAEHLGTEHAIYGIQAKGVDGLEEPLDRIEDMARFYVDALHGLQPHGPYLLIGYSFGGLVALEMAQRLSSSEEQVGLLILVDAYPSPRYLSPGQRLQLGAHRTARRLSEIKKKSFREAVKYIAGGLKRRLRIPEISGERPQEASQLSLAHTISNVKAKSYVALARYRPRVYAGEIKFVKSESDTYFPGDPVPVWANLVANLEVAIVPGNHLNIVTTHFESLADIINRYLREAGC